MLLWVHLVAGTAALLVSSPLAAAACPMCYGSSSSRVIDTYYLSTLMLSLLPFAIVTTIVAVALSFRRPARARRRRATHRAATPLAIRPQRA